VLEARCAFVNCIPVFIAREKYWQQRFEKKGLPVIGDDIKSQVGATITHRVLFAAVRRARRADRPHVPDQLRRQHGFPEHARARRLESKKISKTRAVTSIIPYELGEDQVHVGPSDYIPWSRTASGATSEWRARRSATCRSTSR